MSPAENGVAARLRQVCCSAGGRRILDSVTLDIAAGCVTGILGPNGAGKSTLLGVLTGLRNVDSGSGELLGAALPLRSREVRRRIGVVLQETALYDELSAAENLRFSAALYGVRDRSAVGAVLTLLGLEDRADDRTGTLSGGLRRRVAIARALLHQPELLIIDEPTLGVDADARNAIWAHLRLLRARGTTVIVASNYLDEVQALCDHVAVLRQGRLVAQETPEALTDRAGQCIDVECDPAEVDALERALARQQGVRVVPTPSGAIVFARVHGVADVVRVLVDDVGARSFRVRSPDLAEVLRAYDSAA